MPQRGGTPPARSPSRPSGPTRTFVPTGYHNTPRTTPHAPTPPSRGKTFIKTTPSPRPPSGPVRGGKRLVPTVSHPPPMRGPEGSPYPRPIRGFRPLPFVPIAPPVIIGSPYYNYNWGWRRPPIIVEGGQRVIVEEGNRYNVEWSCPNNNLITETANGLLRWLGLLMIFASLALLAWIFWVIGYGTVMVGGFYWEDISIQLYCMIPSFIIGIVLIIASGRNNNRCYQVYQ